MAQSVLYLDFGGDNIDIHICQNLSNYILKNGYTLLNVIHTSIKLILKLN